MEVTGSNPIEALIFFRLLLKFNCLNWKIYCNDDSSHSSTTALQNYFIYILHICRQSQSEKLSTRCNQLQEKLNMAISTLQQALGGINSQVSESVAKVSLVNTCNLATLY